jgi:hypothetical protein
MTTPYFPTKVALCRRVLKVIPNFIESYEMVNDGREDVVFGVASFAAVIGFLPKARSIDPGLRGIWRVSIVRVPPQPYGRLSACVGWHAADLSIKRPYS